MWLIGKLTPKLSNYSTQSKINLPGSSTWKKLISTRVTTDILEWILWKINHAYPFVTALKYFPIRLNNLMIQWKQFLLQRISKYHREDIKLWIKFLKNSVDMEFK